MNDSPVVKIFSNRSDEAERRVWSDRNWEWPPGSLNEPVRSVEMFRRCATKGLLQVVIARDRDGRWLDGCKTHKLSLPQPIPARRFWSITVFDTEALSDGDFDQTTAVRRSRFELKNNSATSALDLYFAPAPPPWNERDWIETDSEVCWIALLCIYGPESAAFDGSWKPGDLEEIAFPVLQQLNPFTV